MKREAQEVQVLGREQDCDGSFRKVMLMRSNESSNKNFVSHQPALFSDLVGVSLVLEHARFLRGLRELKKHEHVETQCNSVLKPRRACVADLLAERCLCDRRWPAGEKFVLRAR